MAGPERKRPGSSSPILLAAAMEQPRIADTAEPVAEPAATALRIVDEAATVTPATREPEAAPQEVTQTEPAAELTTSPPVEESPSAVPTDSAPVATSSVTAAPAPASPAPASTPPTSATPPAPEAPAVFIPENAKTSINMDLLTRLKLRADTAVLRTSGLPGGYRSRGQLINAAIEAELIRLEELFNNGEEFPPNMGSFRTGRPLGS